MSALTCLASTDLVRLQLEHLALLALGIAEGCVIGGIVVAQCIQAWRRHRRLMADPFGAILDDLPPQFRADERASASECPARRHKDSRHLIDAEQPFNLTPAPSALVSRAIECERAQQTTVRA
jgi:hypothetical protein